MEDLVYAIRLALLIPAIRRRVLRIIEIIVSHLHAGNSQRLLGTLEAILQTQAKRGRK